MILALKKDVVAGGLYMAIGAGFASMSLEQPIGETTRMGPGFFPLCVGLILGVIGAWVFLTAFRTGGAGGTVEIRARPAAVILVALVAFALLLPRLGLVLTSILVFVLSAAAAPQRSVLQVGLVAVVLAAVVGLVFVAGLRLPIPALPPFLFS
ncbi:tripartite tricarboxylate transporter TctB family protein [Azospirillum sp. YIM B02556]|uniref:Tripartite tricarboxylate transporter TctB family protein n=1 Tax=Azospirillum endophyticum TaxID=2800326 RepID=A0ABS1F8M8_9PROT|nr:tripartite tricarboxylate transporter TctB family protein [Azospirillum endophyticum]MBK1839790.1 tripartite tricarboxylate transporter TctB family protein [Azospirillum endophyticum]